MKFKVMIVDRSKQPIKLWDGDRPNHYRVWDYLPQKGDRMKFADGPTLTVEEVVVHFRRPGVGDDDPVWWLTVR